MRKGIAVSLAVVGITLLLIGYGAEHDPSNAGGQAMAGVGSIFAVFCYTVGGLLSLAAWGTWR